MWITFKYMPNSYRNLILDAKCEICNFDRYLEVCHVVPKRIGGGDTPINKLILCPNHHKLMDYGLLNTEELAKIEHLLLLLIDYYKAKKPDDLRIQEYLYFMLGYKSEPPKWMKGTREKLKNKLSNSFF